MYRTEEKTPEQVLEIALAELKGFEKENSKTFAEHASLYKSATTFRGFLGEADRLLGTISLTTVIGIMFGGVTSMAYLSWWPLLIIVPSLWSVVFLVLLAAYPLYSRAILSDPMNKSGWQLNEALVEMKDRLTYFKTLFTLDDADEKVFSPESKANIARQLAAHSEKLMKRVRAFPLLRESRRLSAKLKTHAAYLEEGDIPEAAKLLGEGARVEEAALAEVSADVEAIALVLKK